MLTDDPTDPRLKRGVDEALGQPQNEVYLVLSDAERARGFVEPVRRSYIHERCGALTTMGTALAETYARQPDFYGATYCTRCGGHYAVGQHGEFIWDGTTQKVGTLHTVIDTTATERP